MCTAPDSLKQQSYQTSKDTDLRNRAYDQLNDRYKRWTTETLQRSGEMDRINQQVSSREAEFNKTRERAMRNVGWRPESETRSQLPSPTSPLSQLRLGRGGQSGTAASQGAALSAGFSSPQSNPLLRDIMSYRFDADALRRDLMREAALKRVESGVYSRTNITADTPSQQVSVIGGASRRASSGSTSGVSRGGTGSNPSTGPTGVKLNIGT